MKRCTQCGAEIPMEADVCSYCGASQEQAQDTGSEEKENIIWGILGFGSPIIGLILYLVWKNTKPGNAGMAGKGAIIGVIGYIAAVLFLALFGGLP